MKVRANTATLADALGVVRPAVRASAPFVVLQATTEGLLVATDNWDIQIRTVLADIWSGEDEGPEIAVPHRPLAELCGHLNTDEIELLATEEGELKVRSGNTDLTLPLADAPLPKRKAPEGPTATIPAASWEIIQKLTVYCSNEQNREILHNVFFDGDMVGATDTYRLGAYLYESGVTAKVPAAMIPKVAKGVEEIQLAADERSIEITVGATTTNGRTIAGDPPAWRRLLAPREDKGFTLDAEQLLEALARVEIPAREATGGGRVVKMDPLGDDTLLLASDSLAVDMLGYCEEVVPVVEGELPFPIQLNSRHLTEAITLIGSSRIELRVMSPKAPVYLGREDLQVLVMPIQPLTTSVDPPV